MKKIFFDACCYNRPLDIPQTGRIKLEADAIIYLIDAGANGGYEVVTSTAIHAELSRMPDVERLDEVMWLVRKATNLVQTDTTDIARADELTKQGLTPFDALHCAVAGRYADVFLTVDDKLLNKARKAGLQCDVANPIDFLLKELTK